MGFQLINGDDDKMDAILVEMGASDQIRQLNRSVKPIVEYSRDGDDYIAKASVPALGKEHSHKFRLNVELDETTWNGKTVTYEREITADGLLVTVSCGALVAKRTYK